MREVGAGRRPRLDVLAGAALWGTTGTAQALGPAAATPAAVGAARQILGAVALVLAALLLRRGGWPRAGIPALFGVLTIAAYQVCFFAGVARTGVAVGTVVGIGSAPVFAGVLGRLVHGERPEPAWARATLLAVAGSALLVVAGADTIVDPLGVVLALGAGASYAAYTVSAKVLLDEGAAPLPTMAALFAGGALLLMPVLAVGDPSWLASPRGFGIAAWLGLATVLVAYTLYGRGLAHLPSPTVATLTLAEPVTAATLGLVLLGERPGLVGLAGAGLVLSGLVLLVVRPRVGTPAGC